MAIDKEKNTKVLVTISRDLLKRVVDYQFENRVKNRSEAIRVLIEKGLESK